MAVFVLNASVTLASCFTDEATIWSEELLERLRHDHRIIVPAHWPTEVANVLLMGVRRKRIKQEQPQVLWNELACLPLDTEPALSTVLAKQVFGLVKSVASRCTTLHTGNSPAASNCRWEPSIAICARVQAITILRPVIHRTTLVRLRALLHQDISLGTERCAAWECAPLLRAPLAESDTLSPSAMVTILHRTNPDQLSRSRPRMLFVDNLRWAMILLVISMHSADTYSPLGNWYFVDRKPLSPVALFTFAVWQNYLQSFFMGLLFFLAGFFVPASYDRKGPWQFVRDRAFRLGLPVLFYMFILGPITEYFCAHSWNSTEPTSFANEWIKHVRNGEFLQESGPLWFCLALLIFSLIYVASRAVRPAIDNRKEELQPPNYAQLVGFALAMAALTFFVRLVFPSGASFLNMHLGDFPQYILLFSAGVLAAHNRWLPKLNFSAGIRWLMIVLPVGFAAWLVILRTGGALAGNGRAYSGGWHWQAGTMNLWESFTCVAICYGLLVIFREKFNRQGRLAKFLSDNAFSVYVFHPPILILAARFMHSLPWPPVLKFVVLTLLSSIASFALSAAVFRRIPLLRNIL
jgi:glucans biosynthesis protein C